jgi:predicted solute-binding protein
VVDLQVDPKASLLTRLMGKISPSLLGLPPAGAALKKKLASKKLFPSTSSSRRSERPATKASTMTLARKAQASACKQLGLISREEDFNEDVLQQYLQLFQQPLSEQHVQGLADLAEVSSRPAF